MLNFTAPFLFQNSAGESGLREFTTAANLAVAGAVGKGVHSNSGDFALEEGGLADGILVTGALSGTTAVMRYSGLVEAIAGDVVLKGVSLTIEDSGYVVPAGVNDNIWGRAIDASAAGNSGSLFTAMIEFSNPNYAAVASDAIVD